MQRALILHFIEGRRKRGFAPIVLIVGKQRMGKTCLALLLAYLLDRNFDVNKQMFFDVLTFAKAVDKYDNKILILDEAGVELDSYRYSDVRQRCFSHIVQTQAYKRNTLFIVLPHASDLAKCHRKYVDALLVVTRRGGYVLYKPNIQYWDMNTIDIRTMKMEYGVGLPLPPKHLYEEYKKSFEKQIKEDILVKEIDKLDKFMQNLQKPPKPKIITTLR